MTQNDKKFVRDMVDFVPQVIKAQTYLKENYNIDSVFNEDECTLEIYQSVNESKDNIKAKEYVEKNVNMEGLEISYK